MTRGPGDGELAVSATHADEENLQTQRPRLPRGLSPWNPQRCPGLLPGVGSPGPEPLRALVPAPLPAGGPQGPGARPSCISREGCGRGGQLGQRTVWVEKGHQ